MGLPAIQPHRLTAWFRHLVDSSCSLQPIGTQQPAHRFGPLRHDLCPQSRIAERDYSD